MTYFETKQNKGLKKLNLLVRKQPGCGEPVTYAGCAELVLMLMRFERHEAGLYVLLMFNGR
jgi:hypothetical protein